MSDFEVLMIDDSSEDNGREIADRFASKDERFKSLSNTGEGIGMARNFGISQAAGRFIGFVDSDDFLNHSYLEKLAEPLLSGADLSICNFDIVLNDGTKLKTQTAADCPAGMDPAIHALTNNECVVWNKLFLSSIFKYENKFQFSSSIFEDFSVIPAILANVEQIAFVDKTLYNYVQHPKSVTRQFYSEFEKSMFVFDAFKHLHSYRSSFRDNTWEYYMDTRAILHLFAYRIDSVLSVKGFDKRALAIKRHSDLLNSVIPNWYKSTGLSDFIFENQAVFDHIKRKIIVRLYQYGFYKTLSFLKQQSSELR